MSNLVEKAITGGQNSQAFDQLRKLAACGLALNSNASGEEAASHADKGIFQKTVEYAVGYGEMKADEAFENLLDRQTATLSVILHRKIKMFVNVGCRVLGGWIGHFFGPQGAVIGQRIGASVARFLNTKVSTVVKLGMHAVKSVARNVYNRVKSGIKSVVSKVSKWLFG